MATTETTTTAPHWKILNCEWIKFDGDSMHCTRSAHTHRHTLTWDGGRFGKNEKTKVATQEKVIIQCGTCMRYGATSDTEKYAMCWWGYVVVQLPNHDLLNVVYLDFQCDMCCLCPQCSWELFATCEPWILVFAEHLATVYRIPKRLWFFVFFCTSMCCDLFPLTECLFNFPNATPFRLRIASNNE